MCGKLPGLTVLLTLSLHGQVTTSQYDNARTGATLQEKILNLQNVNSRQFGKLFKLPVDGDVFAQPLYMPNLAIPGRGLHNVVFVATEHDSVYAFDAQSEPAVPLWRISFTERREGVTSIPAENVICRFISPEVGITSTPVIDPKTNTLYVLARTKERDASGSPRFWQRLHALDVLTGAEKFGGPVVIRASVTSKAGGFFGLFPGTVDFLSLHENPRAALLLDHGRVILSWASSCDVPPYHGWVMEYDAHTLKQIGVLNTSPDAGESGIWQSDTGPAADEAGNVFILTGNGVFDAARGGRDYGDSVVKIGFAKTGLPVEDYFTPFDEDALNRTDGDLGSGGPLLVPEQAHSSSRLLVAGGKGGDIYVLDRNHLGEFHARDNSNALQTIHVDGEIFGAPAYWNGHVYIVPRDGVLEDFTVEGSKLSGQPVGAAQFSGHSGATPAISANGTKDGIVWMIESGGPAILRAYDAANVANELYDSAQVSGRDGPAPTLPFTIPTVAGGRVYVPAAGEVDVYGLLPVKARQ